MNSPSQKRIDIYLIYGNFKFYHDQALEGINKELSKTDSEAFIRYYNRNKRFSGNTYILCDNNIFVGTVSIEESRFNPDYNKDRKHYDFTRFFIKPEYRNRGFAKLLVDTVIEETKKLNLRKQIEFHLITYPSLQPSIEFYKKHLFAEYSINYGKSGIVYFDGLIK